MTNSKHVAYKLFLILLLIFAILLSSYTIFCNIFPRRYTDLINKYCDRYGVDKNLVYALIKAESNFNSDAVSSASAKGIMQLTDDTFNYCMKKLHFPYEEVDIFSAGQNIHAGIWYLSFLLDKYDGNEQNAIAAYNAGASNVDGWLASEEYSSDGKTLDKIPFSETRRHTEKIDKYKKIYRFIY